MGARLGRLRRDPFLPIWPATLVLLLVSPVLAPGSVSGGAIVGMLPFVAILAIASIGQTLVVQQRGLDLSIPGVISLTTILVTKIPKGDDALCRSPSAAVVRRLPRGGAHQWPCGDPLRHHAPHRDPWRERAAHRRRAAADHGAVVRHRRTRPRLASPSVARWVSPTRSIVAVVAVLSVAFVVRSDDRGSPVRGRWCQPGRRLRCRHPVRRYQLATYVVAALFAGLAGILLAGYLKVPGLLPATPTCCPPSPRSCWVARRSLAATAASSPPPLVRSSWSSSSRWCWVWERPRRSS